MARKRRAVGLGVAALVLAVAGGGATAMALGLNGENDAPAAADTAQPSGRPATTTGVYGAPTPTDQRSAPEPTQVATDSPVATSTSHTSRSSTPSGTRSAPAGDRQVVVTYADWEPSTSAVEVGAYVPGVVESDGTCTLTLTQAGRSVTATVPGSPDATSTTCSGLAVPGAQLASGNWRAVVTYESPAGTGESAPVNVTVP